MKPAPIEITRACIEAKIEELIALLDLVDGDENLEPWLADDDPENGDREFDDERQPNGDEQDTCFCEDDNYGVYFG